VITLETLTAQSDQGHERAGSSPRPRARYRFGFFARYLRQFVLAKMDAEGWRQYDVAKFLDMPTHALSEYLNRHTHPSQERRRKLLRLGCEEGELARAEFADKLEWWMSSNGLGPDAVISSLDSIQRYEQEMRFAKIGRSGLRQSSRLRPVMDGPSVLPDEDAHRPTGDWDGGEIAG
jgi:hypothetical protein